MKKILFQGDSITESNRAKDAKYCKEYTGSGYPTLIAAELGCRYINEYEFINRGVSGNKAVDIFSRINRDIISICPDILSILAGVNDVMLGIQCGDGFDAIGYGKTYDLMLSEIKRLLPKTEIVILEPFVLRGEVTEKYWERFRSEVEKRACISEKLAEKYNFTFIPLQNKFDEAYKKAPKGYWLFDGVHPTSAGHKIIADEWIKVFEAKLKRQFQKL